MPSMTSTIGGTRYGTPQKLSATVGRLAGRLARGKATQTKCVDQAASSFALSTKHRLLAVAQEPGQQEAPHALHALVATFSPEGEHLLIGTAQGAVYKVDLLAFKFFLLAYVKDTISCMAAMAGEKVCYAVIGQQNGHLTCVSQTTHETSGERRAHAGAVLGLSVGQQETVCSFSRTQAYVWRGGARLQRLYQLHLNSSANVVKMAFLSDGALLGAFADDSVYVWSLQSLQVTHEVLQLSRHRPAIADVAPTQDADVFYVAGKTNQVFEFNLNEMRISRIFSLPDGAGHVTQVLVFPGPFHGQILAVLLDSGTFKFIHTETGRVVQSLRHSKHNIARGTASASGLFLACLLASGHVCLHHGTGEVFRRIVLPEVFYDSKPRVMLVDESPTRAGRRATAAAAGGDRQNAAPATAALPDASVKHTREKRGKTPLLNTARLAPIVREQGEFPAQYRRLIWRHLLELPAAHALYVTLAERGQHPAWADVAQRYPIREANVAKVMASTLSALAWWCPLFAEVQFLPHLVFPFCSLFSADPLTALEVVVTVLVNWCQRWFEFFPYPPISVLGLVENMLAHHCPDLLRHYMTLGVTAHTYAWPLLETVLSEVLTQHDWLVAWDHVFSAEPSLLLAVVVAYNVVSAPALQRCRTADDIAYYFSNQNVVPVRHVMKRAHVLHETTPEELHPRAYMEPFQAISADAYPVFNKYPTFIVNHQLEERERIGREHRQFLEERGATARLAYEMADHRTKHKQWAEKLAYLKEAEAAHREMLRRSESRLAAQRRRLAHLQGALQQRSAALRHSERSRELLRQTTEKEMLIGRLQDEIRKKRAESDGISHQLQQEERDGPIGSDDVPPPARAGRRRRQSRSRSRSPSGSPESSSRTTQPPPVAVSHDTASSWSPPGGTISGSYDWAGAPAAPLLSARSNSTGASTATTTAAAAPVTSRATVPRARPPSAPLSPTRRASLPMASAATPTRGRRGSPPLDGSTRAAVARAAARVAAVRRTRPHQQGSPTRDAGSPHRRADAHRRTDGAAASSTADTGPPGTECSRSASPRRSSLLVGGASPRSTAGTRRVRLIPGSVDADIGALEREIDEIAADVATLARAGAAAPPSGSGSGSGWARSPAGGGAEETFGSAASLASRHSRSAPDIGSLVGAHWSAQRVREQLVTKWREEERSGGGGRALRPSRSQLQSTTSAQERRPPVVSKHRSRQTIAPRRRASFRSML